MQSVSRGGGTGDALDLHPLEWGKKQPDARYAPHQKSQPPRAAGSAATNARRPCGSPPASALSPRRVLPGPMPTECELASRLAEVVVHPSQARANSAERPHQGYTQRVCGLSSDLLLPLGGQRKSVNEQGQFISRLLLQSTSGEQTRRSHGPASVSPAWWIS